VHLHRRLEAQPGLVILLFCACATCHRPPSPYRGSLRDDHNPTSVAYFPTCGHGRPHSYPAVPGPSRELQSAASVAAHRVSVAAEPAKFPTLHTLLGQRSPAPASLVPAEPQTSAKRTPGADPCSTSLATWSPRCDRSLEDRHSKGERHIASDRKPAAFCKAPGLDPLVSPVPRLTPAATWPRATTTRTRLASGCLQSGKLCEDAHGTGGWQHRSGCETAALCSAHGMLSPSAAAGPSIRRATRPYAIPNPTPSATCPP